VKWELGYHVRVPFNADHETSVHRWFLINASQSVAQIADLFRELAVAEGDLVIDPFRGSGTFALQIAIIGAESLGYDQLGTCDIATRAKVAATETEPGELAMQAREPPSISSRIAGSGLKPATLTQVGSESPVDVQVSTLAESIGFGTSYVRVTHFAEEDERPTPYATVPVEASYFLVTGKASPASRSNIGQASAYGMESSSFTS
jgi:hypothetical protein